MRRGALAVGVGLLLALAGCSGSTTPSSDVATTQLPASALAAASPSAAASAASSAEASLPPASPAVATPTPAPTPKPTPRPTSSPRPTPTPVPVCTSANLTAKVTGWEGAMGSQIATIRVTNTSANACALKGTPRLQLVDAAGHVLLDSKTAGASGLPHVSPGDKSWLMGHLGWVTTMVSVSNYCGSTTPVLPTTIALILPSNGGRIVAAANSSGGAPPCYGNPGDVGSIEMNGWAH